MVNSLETSNTVELGTIGVGFVKSQVIDNFPHRD